MARSNCESADLVAASAMVFSSFVLSLSLALSRFRLISCSELALSASMALLSLSFSFSLSFCAALLLLFVFDAVVVAASICHSKSARSFQIFWASRSNFSSLLKTEQASSYNHRTDPNSSATLNFAGHSVTGYTDCSSPVAGASAKPSEICRSFVFRTSTSYPTIMKRSAV